MELHNLIKEFDKLFPVPHGGILQSLDELEQLVEEIGDRKFVSMAEIGSCFGGTVWLYSQLFAEQGATFTIVDIEIHDWLKRVIKELVVRRPDLKFVLIESPSSEAKLPLVDFLHIDADHRYHMVKADFEHFYPSVTMNGVILLHDTLLDEGPGDHKSGCIRFRKELEASGFKMKTFAGTKMLCDCFGPFKTNPFGRNIGISVIYK